MRTLPLGVLIVCGGTFAALPFRRYQPDQLPIVDPFRVTGPEYSSLIPDEFETTSLRADVLRLDSYPVNISTEIDASEGEPDGEEGVRSMPRYLVRRSLNIPLTFEDLAQPIEHPGSARDRWVHTDSDDHPTRQSAQGDSLAGDTKQTGEMVDDLWNSLVRTSEDAGELSQFAADDGILSDSRERWSAEQVFDQAPNAPTSTGRFASTGTKTLPAAESPSFNLDVASGAKAGDGVGQYSSAWRALPEPTGRDRDHQWIKQP